MIKELKFTEGFPLDIEYERDDGSKAFTLKNKTVKFTDGLNVLFAPNGTGKTTILRAISIYGLTRGGWSNLDFSYMDYNQDYTIDGLAKATFKFKADVKLDGPVFLVEKIDSRHTDCNSEHNGFGDGMFDLSRALLKKMYHSQRSSGQINMYEIGELLVDLIEGNTTFDEKQFWKSRELYGNIGEKIKKNVGDYAKSTILKGGKPTIILDEPDMNLALDTKVGLFTNLLPKLAEKYQVIVATHHSMIAFYKGYNFVNFGNTREGLQGYIKKIIDFYEKGEI